MQLFKAAGKLFKHVNSFQHQGCLTREPAVNGNVIHPSRRRPRHSIDTSTHHTHEVMKIQLSMIDRKWATSNKAALWSDAFTRNGFRSEEPHSFMKNEAVMHDHCGKAMLQREGGKLFQLHRIIEMRLVNEQANLGNVKPSVNLSKELATTGAINHVVSGTAKPHSATAL